MATPRKPENLSDHRCAICGVRLEHGRYVYSRFTKARYCIDVKKHAALAGARR